VSGRRRIVVSDPKVKNPGRGSRRVAAWQRRGAWGLIAMTSLAATLTYPSHVPASETTPSACPPDHSEAWNGCVGIFIFPNGDRYDGAFRNDLPDGQGVYSLSTGELYTGEFRDGAFNGNGALVFPDGSKYVGQFRDGAYDGMGIEYLANGVKGRSGVWFNNQFIRQVAQPTPAATERREVTLVKDAGTFKVPVVVNDSVSLNFTVDSGASDVSVPADVVARLRHRGGGTRLFG
jgi:hypothetical protein